MRLAKGERRRGRPRQGGEGGAILDSSDDHIELDDEEVEKEGRWFEVAMPRGRRMRGVNGEE